MKRVGGVVTYEGGRTQEFSAGTAIHRKWESFAMRHGYPVTPDPSNLGAFPVYTWRLYLAYCALDISEGFDVWCETVEEVAELPDDETVEVPPTRPGVSTVR